MSNFQYQPSTISQHAAYIGRELAAGRFVQTTFDPADGTITGIVGVEPRSAFADQVTAAAERRASTR
jgi:hypothetical protein